MAEPGPPPEQDTERTSPEEAGASAPEAGGPRPVPATWWGPQPVWAPPGADAHHGPDSGWGPRPPWQGGSPWGGGPAGDAWQPRPPRRPAVGLAVVAVLVTVALLAGIGVGRTLPGSAAARPAAGAGALGGVAGGSGGSGTTGTGTTGAGATGAGAAVGGGAGGNPAAAARPPSAAVVAAAAHDVTPSLVDLDTALSYEGLQAAGTGIVFGRSGLVLTNNHVIEGETSLTAVDVATGRHYRGVVVGYDMASDVAVVRLVGAPGLPVARFAPGSAHLGQQVVAVGNAGGRGGAPTAAGGTVTGLDRSITASDQGGGTVEQLSGLISTNADVQLGDSGGSLVDAAGQVLGVDTATLRGVAFSGTSHEGFAIPIATAMAMARRILAGQGSATVHVGPTAFIGVRASASSCSAGAPGTSVTQGSGALVCDVIPDTGASAAGLVPGDLITALSGFPVRTPASLTHLLVEHFHPGETVTVSFRGADGRGAGRGAAVTLGSGPPA